VPRNQTIDGSISNIKAVKQALRARARRRDFFGENLFREPEWDMLLELYLADLQQSRSTVGSLAIAARAPSSSAVRHVRQFEANGLVTRSSDPFDRRRSYVTLSEQGRAAVFAYFAAHPLTI